MKLREFQKINVLKKPIIDARKKVISASLIHDLKKETKKKKKSKLTDEKTPAAAAVEKFGFFLFSSNHIIYVIYSPKEGPSSRHHSFIICDSLPETSRVFYDWFERLKKKRRKEKFALLFSKSILNRSLQQRAPTSDTCAIYSALASLGFEVLPHTSDFWLKRFVKPYLEKNPANLREIIEKLTNVRPIRLPSPSSLIAA